MAGMGKRMRPHTLNTPKPLLKIGGKPLVQRIVEDLIKSTNSNFTEIHFIVGDFGEEVEHRLLDIASAVGSKGFIHYQKEPLGTAHAIYCAEEYMKGEVIIAFADTLFEGNFSIDRSDEAIIWTMRVKHPENYGVVVTEKNSTITGFSEKPQTFVSDEAIIGIYYFKECERLKRKIEYLFEHKILVKGEYQLTDALALLLKDNMKIRSANIEKWLDCGNKNEFLNSAKRVLEKNNSSIKGVVKRTEIIQPVYLGNNIIIEDSTIGPNVTIEDNSEIIKSKIKNSIIYSNTKIINSEFYDSIIGNFVFIDNADGILNIGDYSSYENA